MYGNKMNPMVIGCQPTRQQGTQNSPGQIRTAADIGYISSL